MTDIGNPEVDRKSAEAWKFVGKKLKPLLRKQGFEQLCFPSGGTLFRKGDCWINIGELDKEEVEEAEEHSREVADGD